MGIMSNIEKKIHPSEINDEVENPTLLEQKQLRFNAKSFITSCFVKSMGFHDELDHILEKGSPNPMIEVSYFKNLLESNKQELVDNFNFISENDIDNLVNIYNINLKNSIQDDTANIKEVFLANGKERIQNVYENLFQLNNEKIKTIKDILLGNKSSREQKKEFEQDKACIIIQKIFKMLDTNNLFYMSIRVQAHALACLFEKNACSDTYNIIIFNTGLESDNHVNYLEGMGKEGAEEIKRINKNSFTHEHKNNGKFLNIKFPAYQFVSKLNLSKIIEVLYVLVTDQYLLSDKHYYINSSKGVGIMTASDFYHFIIPKNKEKN